MGLLTFSTAVRKDGAINITTKGRTLFGVKAGDKLSVTFDNGHCILTPDYYTCPICGQKTTDHLNDIGICHECNNLAVSAIKQGIANDLQTALEFARDKRNRASGGVRI